MPAETGVMQIAPNPGCALCNFLSVLVRGPWLKNLISEVRLAASRLRASPGAQWGPAWERWGSSGSQEPESGCCPVLMKLACPHLSVVVVTAGVC